MITIDLRGRYALPANYFLLDPGNSGFVEGRSRQIVGSYKNSLIIASITTIVALVVLGWQLSEWQIWRRFRDEGATAAATIISQRVVEEKSRSYYVTYRYDVPTGAGAFLRYTHEQNIPQSKYVVLLPGASVQVRYLQTAPAVASITWTSTLPLGIPVFGVIAALVISGSVGVMILELRTLRQLNDQGRLLVGHLLSVKSEKDGKENLFIYLRYRFQTPSGRTIVCETSRQRDDLADIGVPGQGSPVVIVYVSDQLYQTL